MVQKSFYELVVEVSKAKEQLYLLSAAWYRPICDPLNLHQVYLCLSLLDEKFEVLYGHSLKLAFLQAKVQPVFAKTFQDMPRYHSVLGKGL